MKWLIQIIVLFPITLHAQQETINFQKGLNWKQVVKMAKSQDKLIYMDCFATWCGPCKEMDREVFPDKDVAKYINQHFISIQVQMDSTAHDNEQVRAWYKDAHSIMLQYKVSAFPTYLFFTSDGKIIHRGKGFQSVDDFLTIATNAADPIKQYYTLANRYRNHELNALNYIYLANTAKENGDLDFATVVAEDYINNILLHLDDKSLYTKDNIDFICQFNQYSTDKTFRLFFNHADKIDSAVGLAEYAQGHIDYIIAKELIDPILFPRGRPSLANPDWKEIEASVERNYDSNYASRTVIDAQLRWYGYKKDSPTLCMYYIKKVNKFGIDTSLVGRITLNNLVYYGIFKHCSNIDTLVMVTSWLNKLVNQYPTNASFIDTYANLIYKMGKKEEAFVLEEKALQLMPNDSEILENYSKMKLGIPTWADK